MRPTDFCTPKPSNSSTRASPSPSAAILSPREVPFGALTRGPHSYRALRLVLVHAKRLLSRSRFARPKTREAGTGQLGPPDANEAGESRGSQRDPHFDGRASAARGRCLPSCAAAVTVSDTPVASSVLVGAGSLVRFPRFGSEAAKTGSAGAL